MEVKLKKYDIREISKYLHLPVWNKPQMPCLASRIPYGIKIEKSILRKIDIAENYLHKLGFTNIRVRHHNSIARIEVSRPDIKLFGKEALREKIVRKLKSLGYKYITVDLEGYRTGSLNLLVH